MALTLYSGNKLEILAELFASRVYAHPDPDPMTGEVIVVQTQGMASWLKLELAGRCGIAANCDTPFLNNFVDGLLAAIFPDFRAGRDDFSSGAMRWKIYAALEEHPENYPALAGYLASADAELRRWQLACRIAGLFDQYQLYRCDELAEWQNGKTLAPRFDWQRRLYLDILAGRRGRDYFYRRFLALDRLDEKLFPPRRINVFGVGAMPPVFLRIFTKLAEFREVNFFYLNPCREFWALLYSPREARFRLEPGELPQTGNPLLASFGAQGREFFSLLCDLPAACRSEEFAAFEDFVPTGGNTPAGYEGGSMLEALQQDIFGMFDRSDLPHDEYTGPPLAFPPGDNSIQIHNCHSPRREVEVLHDRLLGLFQSGGLEYRDVIVMAPDINAFEPYIQAIFSQGPLAGAFSVSDRSLRRAGRIGEAFGRLLRLPDSRFECSEVLALLDVPEIRASLHIDEEDVPKIIEWVNNAGIRWGVDADDRKTACDVPFEDYSWKQGLDRLMMGFARIEPAVPAPDAAIIGVEAAEGGSAELLGKFVEFVRHLIRLRAQLARRRPMRDWVELLRRILDDFFPVDREHCEEAAAIRAGLNQLAAQAYRAGVDSELPREVIGDMVDGVLDAAAGGGNAPFLRGKITFCSLVPMRSIPMKVVAILGLNDGAFPRRDLKLGFNLLSADPRICDRSRQAEDRYLFLEAILSARRTLMLFYDGQSDKGDERFPAALPLAELADYLKRGFGFRETNQKLQPFDPAYFEPGGELFSFSPENFAAAEAVCAAWRDMPREEPNPVGGDTPPEPMPGAIELDDLVRFFANPCRYYLTEHLGMACYDHDPTLTEDVEPFALDHLAAYWLREEVAGWYLADLPEATQLNILRRSSRLAVGRRGDEEFRQAAALVATTPEIWKERMRSAEKSPVELTLGDCRIVGLVQGSPDGREVWNFRYGKWNHKNAMTLLFSWLCANIARDGGCTARVFSLEKNNAPREWVVPPVGAAEARRQLAALMELYQAGQGRPLPVFPCATFACGMADDPEKRMRAASTASNRESYKESEDPVLKRCFPDMNFFDPDFFEPFAAVAEALYAPLRQGEEVTQWQ